MKCFFNTGEDCVFEYTPRVETCFGCLKAKILMVELKKKQVEMNEFPLRCFINGNALCIVPPDFKNLQESEAVFIKISEKTIESVKELL